MGRMLGSFADDEDLDRPDLNKCPDCGCFFSGDNCPLCGKPCPDEMRAGNRKAVPKRKKKSSGPQYRVAFIDWYHRWWFILPMLFFMPLIGIILLATSPHKKSIKITVIVIAIVYTVLSTFGISTVIGHLTDLFYTPVDTSLSETEYIDRCTEVSAEDFFRSPDTYKDEYVSLTLTVTEKIIDGDGYYNNRKYTTYYLCTDGIVSILIRDCRQTGGTQNLIAGDVITIYGEGDGSTEIYDMNYSLRFGPCLNAAYITLVD